MGLGHLAKLPFTTAIQVRDIYTEHILNRLRSRITMTQRLPITAHPAAHACWVANTEVRPLVYLQPIHIATTDTNALTLADMRPLNIPSFNTRLCDSRLLNIHRL
jgi:hypothetical protein